jgi:hypothetical protein
VHCEGVLQDLDDTVSSDVENVETKTVSVPFMQQMMK